MARRTRRTTVLIASATLLACLALPTTTREAGAEAASAGRIVFSAADPATHRGEINAVDADGADRPARLTNDPAGKAVYDISPEISPDGYEIAWTRNGEIWKMRADGSGKTRVVGRKAGIGESGLAFRPSWSPDGDRIAFDRGGDIWTVAADGSDPERITAGEDVDRDPSWSPDGSRIAFARQEVPEPDVYQPSAIFVADATDGSGAVRVSGDGSGESSSEGSYEPGWSPNGSEIVFSGYGVTSVGNYQGQIFSARADGSGTRRVLGGVPGEGSDYFAPTYSPDGSEIAYVDAGTLAVTDSEGTDDGAFRADGDPVRASDPDWGIEPRPDSAEPTVTRPYPAPNGKIHDRTPNIGATARDGEGYLTRADMKLYLDGAPKAFSYDPATDRLSRTTGTLSYGTHRVKVVAKDAAGNAATKFWTFRVVGGR